MRARCARRGARPSRRAARRLCTSWAAAGSVWRACWRCTSTATPAAPQRCARPRARRSAAVCYSGAARGALCAVECACIDRSPAFSLICERLTTTADSPRALRRRARAPCAARLCGGARRASAGLALSPLLNALEKRGRRRGRRAVRAARCALGRTRRRAQVVPRSTRSSSCRCDAPCC